MSTDTYSLGFEDGSEICPSSLSGLPKKKIFVPKQITASKETLYIENLNLKEKVHQLEEEKTKLKTKNEYLNNKLSENNKILLESSKTQKSPLNKFVRMTENLKYSVTSAQLEAKTNKEELENLKKDIRYSQIHELKLELDVYKEECLRLKKIILEISGKEKEIDNKIALQVSLFENLQKENQLIKDKLEKLYNDEIKVKEINEDEKKKVRINKKNKKKIVNLVDENLKLKNLISEKSKEYSDKENSLKNEISYLRRKQEESGNEILQLKMDVQKNEFFKIFYECRFCNFVVVTCESIGICKVKKFELKKNKRIQTDIKLFESDAMKKLKQNKITQTEQPKKSTKDTGIQYEITVIKLEKSIDTSDHSESIKINKESQYEGLKSHQEEIFYKEYSDICIDPKELEIEFITKLENDNIFAHEDNKEVSNSKMKKLKTHKVFYLPSEITKKEPLLKPRILSLTQSKPDQIKCPTSAKSKQKPTIPPFKLPTSKFNPVSIQSKLTKLYPKKAKNDNLHQKKFLNHSYSVSSLRQNNSKEAEFTPSRQSLKSSFSIGENKDDSKDIILEEELYNKIYEDSLHTSSDNSDIFIYDNPLSSYHSAEKFWNSSQSRSVSMRKSRNSSVSNWTLHP